MAGMNCVNEKTALPFLNFKFGLGVAFRTINKAIEIKTVI
jgi:hypothetical protein